MIASVLLMLACSGVSFDYRLSEEGIAPDSDIFVDSDIVIDSDMDSSPVDTAVTISPTGLYGGVLRFTKLEVPCQECFYEYSSSTRVTSVMVLHQPTSRSWNDWIPPSGTCNNSVSQLDPATQFLNLGSSVEIDDGTSSNQLNRVYSSGQPEYFFDSSYPNDFSINMDYGLNVNPNDSLGYFYIPSAVVTPDQISLISPSEVLDSYNSAFQPVVRRGGTTFAWEPPSDGLFFIIVDVYDSSGYYYLGGSLCVGEDSGSMMVDGLSNFPSGSLLAIYIYRYNTSESIIPPNGSTLEGVGQVGLVGTATLAN